MHPLKSPTDMTSGRCLHMLGKECSTVDLSSFCEFVEIWEEPCSSNALYVPWNCPNCNKYLEFERNYKVGLFKEKKKVSLEDKFLFIFLLVGFPSTWAQNIMHMIRSRRNKSMNICILSGPQWQKGDEGVLLGTPRWWERWKEHWENKLQMMRKMKKQNWVPKPRKYL